MQESKEKKDEIQEEFPRLNVSKGGIIGFLRKMKERQLPREENWRHNYRRRGGLGGRGYTKSLYDSVHTKMRRKLAKNGQSRKVKKSRRKAKKKRQRTRNEGV